MIKNGMIAAAMAGLMCFTSCGQSVPQSSGGSGAGFDISFFKNVCSTAGADENVVVSPYSAGVVISMLAEGAGGETEVELNNALDGNVFKAIDLSGGENVVAESSNSIWISDNFSVRNRYVALMEKDYDAYVTTEDFTSPATVEMINDWCADHTSGKITDMIDRLGPDMVMVLVNALYFNAPWEHAFDPESTRDAVFHGRGGDATVPMMSIRDMFNYYEYQGTRIVELPYQGGKYAMYVVLPPKGMDIDALLPYINGYVYDSAMDMLSPKEVVLTMPKFKTETSLTLNKALENMGIRTAFSSAANFKGISLSGPLQLDMVKQKCYIDVNEKGTEAAAVTSAQIRMTSVRPVVTMNVDRPFFFIIADAEEHDVLFAGKIVNL